MLNFLKSYYTYIVECSDGTYYIGMTTDLAQRLKQHNGELSGGAKYTHTRRPVQLKYTEQHMTFKEAAHREYQLKKLPRKKKAQLINQT